MQAVFAIDDQILVGGMAMVSGVIIRFEVAVAIGIEIGGEEEVVAPFCLDRRRR